MKSEEKAGSSHLYLAHYLFLKNKTQPTPNKAIKLQKTINKVNRLWSYDRLKDVVLGILDMDFLLILFFVLFF